MDNKRPIRILHVSYGMDLGGAETLIMNIYRNIDREKVQFDFLLSSIEKTAYEDEIISLGGIIHHIPKYLGYNKASYDKELKAFLIEHPEYLIIHDHLNYSASETFRIAGKLNRICIAHSHGSLRPTFFSLRTVVDSFCSLYNAFNSSSEKIYISDPTTDLPVLMKQENGYIGIRLTTDY